MMRRVVSTGINRFFSKEAANRLASSAVKPEAIAENLVKKSTQVKEVLTVKDLLKGQYSKEPMREMTKKELEELWQKFEDANSPGGGYY